MLMPMMMIYVASTTILTRVKEASQERPRHVLKEHWKTNAFDQNTSPFKLSISPFQS